MKIFFGLKLMLIGAIFSSNALAAQGNAEAGQAQYASCVLCHGQNGEGKPSAGGPALTGQSEEYLARQIGHFKRGIRGADATDIFGGQMRAMSSTLSSDQAVADVSAYIAAMDVTGPIEKTQGDTAKGAYIYQGSCASCHGGKGEGKPPLNAPRLAGLDGTYLIRQFVNFKSGLRGSHAEDIYGRQMKEMAKAIRTDDGINNLAAYITSLHQ